MSLPLQTLQLGMGCWASYRSGGALVSYWAPLTVRTLLTRRAGKTNFKGTEEQIRDQIKKHLSAGGCFKWAQMWLEQPETALINHHCNCWSNPPAFFDPESLRTSRRPRPGGLWWNQLSRVTSDPLKHKPGVSVQKLWFHFESWKQRSDVTRWGHLEEVPTQPECDCHISCCCNRSWNSLLLL